MNLAKYQALLSVVESGSLTAAAVQLGLTQSAVSHSINSLEAVSYTHLTLPTNREV